MRHIALALAALLLLAGGAAAQEPRPAPEAPLVLRLYGIGAFADEAEAAAPSLGAHPGEGLAPRAALAGALRPVAGAGGGVILSSGPGDVPPFSGPRGTVYEPSALEEQVEQWLAATDSAGRGSVELAGGALAVRATEAAHAYVARCLDALRAVRGRHVPLEARVVALSSSDPALLAPSPGALLRAALERGRPVFSAGRDAVRSSRVLLGALETRTGVGSPAERILSGVEVEAAAHVSPVAGEVLVSVEAADVSLEALTRARLLGADLDLPSRAERSALACVAIPEGGRDAIALGPRGASETAVLVLGAGAWSAAGPSIVEAARRGGGVRACLDAAVALDRRPGEGRGLSPDALQEAIKGATGGEEAWSDGTAIEVRRGVVLLVNRREVVSATAEIVAAIASARRPRSLDAWALRAPSAPSATGRISSAEAEALLSRAARGDGVSLAGRLGGGLSPGAATFARSCTTARYVGAIEGAPLPCEVEAGLALEARLGIDGDASAGVSLEAALVEQRADLSRTARVSLADASAEVRLPALARREVAGRAALPREGGWALLASGEDGGEGALLLLLRLGP